MNNQGKPSPYGSLVHKPEHYNILMQLETSRNPDYIKDPFINKNGTAGPLQLRRTAFEDLQKHGWLKDQEYDSISGPMATAAGMKYADLIANHYGLKDPYWNALAYKEGPTLAKKLYDRHKGSIKKALQDSEMPAEGVDYLIKYSKTKLADYAKQTAVSPYIKDMYNTITRGGDINSIDPAKYQTTEVPKFKEGDEVTNPGFLSFPGMTKYTAPFVPAVGMLSNAVGFSANTKSDLFQGAGLGALSGFLSGGLPGAVLGGGASLLAYGSKMAGEENAKYEAEQAELKARTIPGRTGFESPLQYAAEGGPTVTKDTIYPNPTNQFLFEKYKKDGVLPKFIVNETGSTPGRELSGFDHYSNDRVDRRNTAKTTQYEAEKAKIDSNVNNFAQFQAMAGPLMGLMQGQQGYMDYLNKPKQDLTAEQGFYGYQKGGPIKPDSNLENILEIVDPTGILSYDDVYREYKKSGLSFETAMEVIGALPYVGKIGKLTKAGIHLKKYKGLDNIIHKGLNSNRALANSTANSYLFTGKASDMLQARDEYLNEKQKGGMINSTGYTPGYPSMNNPYNIIPSNQITMRNTPFPVMGIGNNGQRRMMMPGNNYNFPGASYVTEIPMKYQEGGPTVTKDTIYPNPTNQFLFEKYKKDGVLPKFIVNETGSTPGRELSGFEKGLKKADDVLSAPARYMVQAITGKYQDPSEAWGYNNPQGFWQNAANVGIDIVADPMNLLGVGIAEKVGFKTIPKLTKLGKASEIGNTVGDVVIKADLDLARKYMSDPKNLKDFYKGKVDSKFNDFVNIAYREMPEIKTVVEKSLKLNKPEVAMALINDAIKIKEGGGNYNKKTPVYPESNFGPLASGYKAAVPNLGMKFQSKVVQKKTIPKKIVQTNNTVEPIKEDDIINIPRYTKLVGGVRIPISEKEHAEILSKGKVSTVKGQTIQDNIRPKVRFTEKKEEGGYVEGKQYVLPEYEIKKVPKYQMGNPVEPKYTSMVMPINGPYSSELQKFLNDKNTQVVPMSMDGTNSYTATNDPFYDSNEPLKDLDPIQITANRIHDPLDVMYKVQTLNNFAKGTKRDKQLTSIFETISKLKDKPLLNKLNVTNNKFKLGGEPDIVPPGNLSPLQTEKDEFVIHPNFDVTKSAARLPHSAMTNEVTDTLTAQQTDEQGNVIAPGAYVVSADKKMAIPKSLAEQVNLGIAPAYYSEDMHLPQAEEMNFAKLLYGGKVRMTPAELTKATLKKYPKSVRNEDEDLFAEKGTMANKAARIMPLELIKGLNDFMRDTNELAEGFEEDSDDPEEMKMGGKVKKCRTGGYVDKYEIKGEVTPATLDINKIMQETLARLQAQQNAPLPYEVGALPQALNMGAGAFGMAALAAQNPISKIYQPDASILRDTAKPFSNAPIKSVFDNAQATQNQAIQNAANTSGVRQQDIPSLFSENNLVNAENQAILGNMQNNAQLGRKYASDIIGWQARGVEGENRNITDLNRHIGQIGTLGADTITNAGNIVAGTQTYKQARDANINENIFNLAQSAQMLKMYESMMPKTNTGSDTSAVPTSNTGTTIDNKGVVRQPVPQQGFESNTSYSNVPPSFLGKSPLTVPGDLNNITAPDEILPQQLPFDPNSFRGVPIDANDGFTYTKNPITGKWTKTKTENKIKNQPYQ